MPFLVFSDTDPPKPEVYTEKIRTGGGLFGYNTVTETRIEEFENGNLLRVFRKLTCSGPAWSRCNFVYNAGCANDMFPFTNMFYNNQFDCIEAQIESGVNNGNILFSNNTNDCSAYEQSYRIQLNWTSYDVHNSNEEIIIEKMPFVIPFWHALNKAFIIRCKYSNIGFFI